MMPTGIVLVDGAASRAAMATIQLAKVSQNAGYSYPPAVLSKEKHNFAKKAWS